MAREFKAHRAGPARPGITPLGGGPNRAADRARLAARRHPGPAETATPPQGPRPIEEIGGPGGPEPTRYGDWERNGICYDF